MFKHVLSIITRIAWGIISGFIGAAIVLNAPEKMDIIIEKCPLLRKLLESLYNLICRPSFDDSDFDDAVIDEGFPHNDPYFTESPNIDADKKNYDHYEDTEMG